MNQENPQGVVIPPETVAASNEKKQRRRTLRQTPIYRDAANLKYMVACLYDTVPRKMTKFIDVTLMTVSEAKKCIGLADGTRNAADRHEYYTVARYLVEDVIDDITILHKRGFLGKKEEKEMKGLARGVVSQTIALRDYFNGRGTGVADIEH